MADLKDEFTVKELLELDEGAFRVCLQQTLDEVMKNIADQPCSMGGKTKPRQITIKLNVVPYVVEDKIAGRYVLSKVGIVPEIDIKMPKTIGGQTQVRLAKQDGRIRALWNPESPQDCDVIGPCLPGFSDPQ